MKVFVMASVFVALLMMMMMGTYAQYRRTPGEICNLPPETGRCFGNIPRYFYNTETRTCQIFTYGGCPGNNNNFETESACQDYCGSIEVGCMDEYGTMYPPNTSYIDVCNQCFCPFNNYQFCTMKMCYTTTEPMPVVF